jgi:putative phosphoesterase
MKVVVFSDAHGNKQAIKRIIEFNPDADYVISLGDSECRHSFLLDLDIIAIKGNYPRDGGDSYESILEIEGKRLFLTHGHKFGVGNDLEKLLNKGKSIGADVLLYGHTHVPKLNVIEKIIFLNPGSISSPRCKTPPSYLILNIEKGKEMTYIFKESQTNLLIERI